MDFVFDVLLLCRLVHTGDGCLHVRGGFDQLVSSLALIKGFGPDLTRLRYGRLAVLDEQRVCELIRKPRAFVPNLLVSRHVAFGRRSSEAWASDARALALDVDAVCCRRRGCLAAFAVTDGEATVSCLCSPLQPSPEVCQKLQTLVARHGFREPADVTWLRVSGTNAAKLAVLRLCLLFEDCAQTSQKTWLPRFRELVGSHFETG